MRYFKIIVTLFFFILVTSQSLLYGITIEEEKRLGREFFLNVAKHIKIINDPEVSAYLEGLKDRLSVCLKKRYFPLKLFMTDSGEINAFAGPGGYIFINKGLFLATKKEEELMAVIAHEAAHVEARHISKIIGRAKKVNLATMAGVLAGIVLGKGKGKTAAVVGSIAAGHSMMLKYTRQHEREADLLALHYMECMKCNPESMMNILERIQYLSFLSPKAIPPYLSTHPGLTSRLQDVETYIHNHPFKFSPRNEDTYNYVKLIVIINYNSYEEARDYFLSILDKEPAWANFGLGLLYMNYRELKRARSYMEKAFSMMPNKPWVVLGYGKLKLQEGDYLKAISYLKKAKELGIPMEEMVLPLGMTYERLGKLNKAIALYEDALLKEPRSPLLHRKLGMLYGRQNRLGLAHYHLGYAFFWEGKGRKASFHFQEALKFPDLPLKFRTDIKKKLKDFPLKRSRKK